MKAMAANDIEDLVHRAQEAYERELINHRVWRRDADGYHEGRITDVPSVEDDEPLLVIRWDGEPPRSHTSPWVTPGFLGDHRPFYGPPTPEQRQDISDLLLAVLLSAEQLTSKYPTTTGFLDSQGVVWREDHPHHA